jgi:hypothetical protein
MEVLIVAGLHVPVILLVEVVGSAGAIEFWQKGPIAVKDGATCDEITILIVVGIPHSPGDGVNV